MYKINDLRRLKKNELLGIVSSSKILLKQGKTSKKNIIDQIIEAGHCQVVHASAVASDDNTLPVDLTSECLHYRKLTDTSLILIPRVSFFQVYTYICRKDKASMKCLDRAVKHASAGDVTAVKMCQVC